MSYLFLREKECWGSWTLVGLIGASLTLLVSYLSYNLVYVTCTALIITTVFSLWLRLKKHCYFARAWRLICYIFSLCLLPSLIQTVLLNTTAVVPVESVLLCIAIGAVYCFVLAWLAKAPKEYY